MRNFISILCFCNIVFGQALPKYGNAIIERSNKLNDMMDVTDRKYADHNGNRVLCRIYNFGGIGALSSNVSGVYPIGTSHSYFYELYILYLMVLLD